jgi:hypothetical protein
MNMFLSTGLPYPKQVEKEIVSDAKVLSKAAKELRKAKKPCSKALQKLGDAISKYDEEKKNKGAKASDKAAKKAQAAAYNAAKKFSVQVEKMKTANKEGPTRERISKNIQVFQDLESQRANAVQIFIRIFAKTQSKYLDRAHQEVDSLYDVAEHINVEEDLVQFSDRCISMGGKADQVYFQPPKYDLIVSLEQLSRTDKLVSMTFGTYFGVSLERAIANEVLHQPQQIEGKATRLPKVFTILLDAVMQKGDGLATKGIFRISTTSDSRAELEAKLEKGDFNIPGSDPHLPAGVLKKWLRDLPEPLVPSSQFEACVKLGKLPQEGAQEIKSLCDKILKSVPELSRLLLQRLCEFIVEVAGHEDKNMMGLSNLGVVFGPCTIRPSDDEGDSMAFMQNAKYVGEALVRICEHLTGTTLRQKVVKSGEDSELEDSGEVKDIESLSSSNHSKNPPTLSPRTPPASEVSPSGIGSRVSMGSSGSGSRRPPPPKRT